MKKEYTNGIIELESAYKSDLDNGEFNEPLIFIDKKTNKCTLEKLPSIEKEEYQGKKIDKKSSKELDIVYIKDATYSMNYEIKAAKDNVIGIFNQLTKNYKDYNFRFGSVFYRDKIDEPTDKDEYFQFTNKMEDL